MARIIQLSEAASIAIHSMVLIARSKKLTNVTKIAELTGASRNHLAKVMQRLVKEELVKSTRGPSGGFVLGKDPKKISLLDIYQAIEGQIHLDECPLNRPICPNNKCIMGGLVNKITKEFKDYFKTQTLADYL